MCEQPESEKMCGDQQTDAFLRRAAGKSAQMLELIRKHGFVFETDLRKSLADSTDAERWEKLAFTLYSELVDLSVKAEHVIESWKESKDDEPNLPPRG